MGLPTIFSAWLCTTHMILSSAPGGYSLGKLVNLYLLAGYAAMHSCIMLLEIERLHGLAKMLSACGKVVLNAFWGVGELNYFHIRKVVDFRFLLYMLQTSVL